MNLIVAPHPTLRLHAFETTLPRALGDLPSPDWLTDLLAADATTPLHRSEELRTAIRDMLRHGGYKPTGRGKPASEYLDRAANEGGLRSINLVVDACNATSPFEIRIADPGTRYVFNASGQEIDVAGLLCVFDAEGPCANAVKDAQRTKTTDDTTRTLSVIWGCAGFESSLDAATSWYRELLHRSGASTSGTPYP